jgi:hypothetical protein
MKFISKVLCFFIVLAGVLAFVAFFEVDHLVTSTVSEVLDDKPSVRRQCLKCGGSLFYKDPSGVHRCVKCDPQ